MLFFMENYLLPVKNTLNTQIFIKIKLWLNFHTNSILNLNFALSIPTPPHHHNLFFSIISPLFSHKIFSSAWNKAVRFWQVVCLVAWDK